VFFDDVVELRHATDVHQRTERVAQPTQCQYTLLITAISGGGRILPPEQYCHNGLGGSLEMFTICRPIQ